MKKYRVIVINNGAENTYISTSRNAVQHLRNFGGNCVYVQTMGGKDISAAERGGDGKLYRVMCYPVKK